MTGKKYHGDGLTLAVEVHHPDGSIQRLEPRNDLYDHSPDGFNWGYGGSGPAQLALALCADVMQDDARALRIYQTFKRTFVATMLRQGETWDAPEAVLDQLMKEAERDFAHHI